MKKIAFYLPQFHAIPENDEWWGKGFTEWVNVKNAKPQFKGHNQPEVPLNQNYYNLSDVSVMERQAEMAKKYGIDGFCYYHYWFEGHMLLQKPLENMLKTPSVDMPFMICWANESWSRTWDGAETKLLIKQNYNETKEMIETHFHYLLNYFKDDRYIKINEKPVFIIYKPYLFDDIKRIMTIWNKMAVEAGFKGIMWGFQHHTCFEHLEKLTDFDFGIEFEPFYTVWEMSKAGVQQTVFEKVKKKLLKTPTIYNYDEIWDWMIERKKLDNIMPGSFTAWDNTPRRGRKSIVFFESTPEKFKKYLSSMLQRDDKGDVLFHFINAWNEWAEGAHLEPDERNGFGYLEAVKESK